MKKPLFIFGYPRSGTTLLRSVLDQHPKVSLKNEPELIFALYHAGYNFRCKFPKNSRNDLLKELGKIGLCKKHLEILPEELLKDFLDDKSALSFVEVYEKLLPRPYNDEVVWGEKSLNSLFFIREIFRMYPQALFIHIVRDARSVILSYYNKKTQAQENALNIKRELSFIDCRRFLPFFTKNAILWSRWMEIAKSSLKELPPKSWITALIFLINEPRNSAGRDCLAALADSKSLKVP